MKHQLMQRKSKFLFFALVPFILILNHCASKEIKLTSEDSNSVTFKNAEGFLTLRIAADDIIRVAFSKELKTGRNSLVVINPLPENAQWKIEDNYDAYVLSTRKLKVFIDKSTSSVGFTDLAGKSILTESQKPRELKDTILLNEKLYRTENWFEWKDDEGIYGLGQFQEGIMNYRGHHLRMIQDNTVDISPVLYSNKGYALLFDQYCGMEFRDNPELKQSGSIWCDATRQSEYYFVYGPHTDSIIAGIRDLTGNAPLFGKWAYGFWQCKEHYHTQQELLDVVKELRKRNVPLDNIVQDWYYWEPQPWGSHAFDPERYPSPEKMISELHKKYNTRIMISVWPKFDPGSANYKELNEKGLLYPPTNVFGASQYYDAFNPQAREIYWKQIRDSLFTKGVDAWWLDATEPEIGNLHDPEMKGVMNNYLGSGAEYVNAYSLMTTKAVYEGQRETDESKRVFILTRSAFAGQQRNAAASWSGDISASWEVFSNQIAGGINLAYTGLPYWTTDIGAFFVNDFTGGNKNKEYQELFTRWYQFGAFCPIFRVHGTNTPREIYQFGEPGYWAYDTQLKFNQLRYRLLPYIYSLAWMVTNEGYTLMRGLNFDFRNDKNVSEIADQYMFGPAFLVNPVTEVMYNKDFNKIKEQANLIPSDNLLTHDGQKGLKGSYFNGSNHDTLKMERIDQEIDFEWGVSNPARDLNYDYYSIRWEGKIKAEQTGEYTFITLADDGTRLWISNEQLINDWTQHGAEYRTGKISLTAGKEYDVKLEYNELIGGATVKLLWITPMQNKEIKELAAQYNPHEIKSRKVYLPESNGWFDFWTGEKLEGGQTINALAPVDIMPLYVKAGSIVPMGPVIQHTEEKSDPVEIRIYPGADASFILYEDEGDNYNYERGSYAAIPIKWNDETQTITIGARSGEFPGMQHQRTFNMIRVKLGYGMGLPVVSHPEQSVRYDGNEIKVQLSD